MSRSNYSEDPEFDWHQICWRGAVKSAIRGRRGQKLLRDMLAALDALPKPELITGALVTEDMKCCALGAVALYRDTGVSHLDPEDYSSVAGEFNVAEALVREIAYENDEMYDRDDEQRFRRMRKWVIDRLKPT